MPPPPISAEAAGPAWPELVPAEHESRILILAPTANDARLTAEFLSGAGYAAAVVPTIEVLCQKMAEGCGTVILAEETITSATAPVFFNHLERQPPWSDLPVTLITSGGSAGAERMRHLAGYGVQRNVTLLERPFRPGTLVSAVEVALRSRKRQYEVRNLLVELARARDLAEKASQAKDEFLAALSHELRTPLNPALLLASEAAADPSLPESVRQDFSSIARNVMLEARLIDDLLDLTRITRGKLSLELKPLDARTAIQAALETIQPEVSEKRLRLTFRWMARHHTIVADAVRFQQILWNLLKNAVKFTPPNGTIAVETRDHHPELQIRVSDSGIGMDADELARIFGAFVQGNHARSGHRFGGLGLGLAISRQLAQLHGGRITAESAGPGKGATFTVVFPLAPGAIPTPEDQTLRAHPAGLAGPKRILLIEDHAPSRTSLSRLLARRGYLTETAASIAEAQVLLASATFDLILSDIGLPDGSPHELMREAANRLGVPGIALSGYGMENDLVQSRAAGFADHLTKPITAQALYDALDRIFSLPPAHPSDSDALPSASAPAGQPAQLN